MYRLKFKSHGDSKVSQHVVELLKEVRELCTGLCVAFIFGQAGIRARTSPKSEPRGHDGLGQTVAGFDHGVFVPFKIMFGEEFTEIPIIEVSFDGSMDPEKNWAIGQAIKKLRSALRRAWTRNYVLMNFTCREEQVLLLSGGLVIHNLRDFSGFSEETAKPQHLAFDKAVLDAVQKSDVSSVMTSSANSILTMDDSPQNARRPCWALPRTRDSEPRNLTRTTSSRYMLLRVLVTMARRG